MPLNKDVLEPSRYEKRRVSEFIKALARRLGAMPIDLQDDQLALPPSNPRSKSRSGFLQTGRIAALRY
jgi:hypothetical protein